MFKPHHVNLSQQVRHVVDATLVQMEEGGELTLGGDQ